MGSNLPIVLIEVVLIFGGVLAFGWWQLRSLARDRAKSRAERESASRDPASEATGDEH
jgi:predicted negative regulator of RcsB-dependent stress response